MVVSDMKIESKCFRNERRKESLDNNYEIGEVIGIGRSRVRSQENVDRNDKTSLDDFMRMMKEYAAKHK